MVGEICGFPEKNLIQARRRPHPVQRQKYDLLDGKRVQLPDQIEGRNLEAWVAGQHLTPEEVHADGDLSYGRRPLNEREGTGLGPQDRSAVRGEEVELSKRRDPYVGHGIGFFCHLSYQGQVVSRARDPVQIRDVDLFRPEEFQDREGVGGLDDPALRGYRLIFLPLTPNGVDRRTVK